MSCAVPFEGNGNKSSTEYFVWNAMDINKQTGLPVSDYEGFYGLYSRRELSKLFPEKFKFTLAALRRWFDGMMMFPDHNLDDSRYFNPNCWINWDKNNACELM